MPAPYAGFRDLPGIRLRHLPDPDGELGTGVFLGFPTTAQRQRFAALMKAESVPVSPPAGLVVLPWSPKIESKVTVVPPSFLRARPIDPLRRRLLPRRHRLSSPVSPAS